jgi:hypothetical protein
LAFSIDTSQKRGIGATVVVQKVRNMSLTYTHMREVLTVYAKEMSAFFK